MTNMPGQLAALAGLLLLSCSCSNEKLSPVPADASTDGAAGDSTVQESGADTGGTNSFDRGRTIFTPAERCQGPKVPGDHEGAMVKADQHTRATVSDGGNAGALAPTTLTPISQGITHKSDAPGIGFVQVVTWAGQKAIDNNYYVTPPADAGTDDSVLPVLGGNVWVTLSGEIEACCKEFAKLNPADDLDGRLEQLLGLVHPANYVVFIGIWVDPNDLLRPCPNPSNALAACDNGPISEPVSPQRFIVSTQFATYEAWYRGWIQSTFGAYETNGYGDAGLATYYPFTGLGYSYDWADTSTTPIGASEYVVLKGAHYVFDGNDQAVMSTSQYCGK